MEKQTKNKTRKVGDYVYMVGWGIGLITSDNVISTSELTKPPSNLLSLSQNNKPTIKLPGLKQADTQKIPPFMAVSKVSNKKTKLKAVIIPVENEQDKKAMAMDANDPKLLDPFDRETFDKALEEAWTPQEPRFDNLEDLKNHAVQLLNSKDLVDVGRAYSYVWGQPGNGAKAIAIQAIKILLTQKGYLDYIQRGLVFDTKAFISVSKKLELPKSEGPITFLKGQDPAEQEKKEVLDSSNADSIIETEIPPYQPRTLEERQLYQLNSYFNELAENMDQENFTKLSFLIAIFNNPKTDQMAFHQRYIILHELFGEQENTNNVVNTVRQLGASKKARKISPQNYRTVMRSAFKEISHIIDQDLSLEVDENTAQNPEAFQTLCDQILTFTS